jgi:uncharacterized protein YbjQ (UPF0145 family)
MEADMILSTTSALDNKKVTKYLGVVTGEAIIGANIFRDIFASITDVIGGRSGAYEKSLQEAREIALRELQAQAEELGADAVIGVDLDYETMEGMLMVSVSGTAVKL